MPMKLWEGNAFSCIQWQIWDFPEGAPTPKVDVLTDFFVKNCMEIKEFGPQGRMSLAHPPPLRSAMVSVVLSMGGGGVPCDYYP